MFLGKCDKFQVYAVKGGIVLVAAAASINFFNSSEEGASEYLPALSEIAGACAVYTNSLIIGDSFFKIKELITNNGEKRSACFISFAAISALACSTTNFFLNIQDEDGNYVDHSMMAFYAIVSLVGVPPLMYGIVKLKDRLPAKCGNEASQESKPEDDENTPNYNKCIYYLINIIFGICLAFPNLSVTVLESFDGLKEFLSEELEMEASGAEALAVTVAAFNGASTAGFVLTGLDDCAKAVAAGKVPPIEYIIPVLPAAFSGFSMGAASARVCDKRGLPETAREVSYGLNAASSAGLYNGPAAKNAIQRADQSMGEPLKRFKKKITPARIVASVRRRSLRSQNNPPLLGPTNTNARTGMGR